MTTQYSAEQLAKWAGQLEAIDVVLSVNNQLKIRYCDGLVDVYPPTRVFEKTTEYLLRYLWHQAHDELERVATHTYSKDDREIAAAAAVQVRTTYNYFAELLTTGRVAEAASHHGLLDAYLIIKS